MTTSQKKDFKPVIIEKKIREGMKMSVIKINKENFKNEVLNSDKPVLLDFYADWCTPCHMVSPIIEQVSEENGDIKVGKVNVDEQPEIASMFGVMNIPTFIMFKEGKVVDRVMGAVPKSAILKMIGK